MTDKGESPRQFEAQAPSERHSFNAALELRGAHDNNTVALNKDLHGEHGPAIESHLKAMSNVESVPTQETQAAAKEYNQYKDQLIKTVFDNTGKVRDDAPTKSIQALYDLNNAEVAATQNRITSVVKSADNMLTLASFGDSNGNTLPKTLRETQA
jgi:hypothetical protein